MFLSHLKPGLVEGVQNHQVLAAKLCLMGLCLQDLLGSLTQVVLREVKLILVQELVPSRGTLVIRLRTKIKKKTWGFH